MTSLLENLPQLLLYKPALIGLSILCLIALIQGFLCAPLAFIKEEQMPGLPLKGDHSLLSFRVLRTYSNSVENLPAFGFALLVAVLVGVGPSLVNWLVGIHVLSRVAFWVVYYSGTGKVAGGPRTISYVIGSTTNIVLVIACLYTLLS